MLRNITLIIPTHNRHNYLGRILQMYAGVDIPIVIADSTPTRYDAPELQQANITYLHLPHKPALAKWVDALDKVYTPYICYCADDDYIFLDALQEAVLFLQEREEYVCAQGELLFYKYYSQDQQIRYTPSILKFASLDAPQRQKRVHEYASPYRHFSYGVHRLENLKKIMRHIQSYPLYEPYLFELCHTLLVVLSGRVKALPSLYHLREMSSFSTAKVSRNIATLWEQKDPQIKVAIEILEAYYLTLEPAYSGSAKELFLDAIENFVHFLKVLHKEQKKAPKILYTQQEIVNIYRKQRELVLIEKSILEHKINSGYLFVEDSAKIFLSQNTGALYMQIERLSQEFYGKRVLIYGAGTWGRIICRTLLQSSILFVDKAAFTEQKVDDFFVFALEDIRDLSYDVVLISVLGYERDIAYVLETEYGVQREKIRILEE